MFDVGVPSSGFLPGRAVDSNKYSHQRAGRHRDQSFEGLFRHHGRSSDRSRNASLSSLRGPLQEWRGCSACHDHARGQSIQVGRHFLPRLNSETSIGSGSTLDLQALSTQRNCRLGSDHHNDTFGFRRIAALNDRIKQRPSETELPRSRIFGNFGCCFLKTRFSCTTKWQAPALRLFPVCRQFGN